MIKEAALEESLAEAKESERFRFGQGPKEKWWEVFASKELSMLMEQALRDNPSIQSIKERVESAKQQSVISRSKLFPLIFFDADESWEYLSKNGLYHTLNPSLSQNANLIDLSLGFSYEFDFWGKNRNLFLAALGEELAVRAESKQVELIIASSVAQTYFALKSNARRKVLTEELVTVKREISSLEQLLRQSALSSKLQPAKSIENLEEDEKRLSEVAYELKSNLYTLHALLGKKEPLENPLEEPLKKPPEELMLPERLSLNLLARRPDITAALWRVKAEGREVKAAIADFYPNINLKGLLGLESLGFDKLLQGSSRTAGLFPAIHLPIFTAGAIRANVRSKRAKFNEAIFEYNRLVLDATKEVATYLTWFETTVQQQAQQEMIMQQALLRLELTQQNLDAGLDNALDLLYMRAEWIEKSLEETTRIYNQYLAAIRLIKALGGGYETHPHLVDLESCQE